MRFFLALLFLPGCAYVKSGDSSVFLAGNFGITRTAKASDSDSRTLGIPFLNGGFENTESVWMAENQQQPTMTVGDVEIHGTFDTSTWVDTTLGWSYRVVRAVVTGRVFRSGIEAARDVELAEESAEVQRAGIAAGTREAQIDAAVRQAQIDASVELAQ